MLTSSNVLYIPFFFNDTATTEIYTLSLHDALPICFGGIPPRIDAIGVRGRGRDCLSGPVGSPVVVGLLPLAGRPDDGHQQSDREPAHLGLRPTRRPLVTPLRRADRGSGVRSRGRRAGHGYTRYTPWRGR